MPNQIFTSLLEALEEEYGSVTQAEIAKALRVTQPTISNWKNGGEPSKSNLKKLNPTSQIWERMAIQR
jgi:transcriptional regulator with XRE-family HTH domain